MGLAKRKGDKVMKKFFCGYNCSYSGEVVAVLAKNIDQALAFAHELARDLYDTYFLNIESVFNYNQKREEDIEYWAEPFDYKNLDHVSTLKAQDNEFWQI